MIHNQYVDEYIDDYKSGKILLNDERKKLIKLLEEDVLQRDVYFDERRITNCIKFIEKWYFPLQPFQKFIIAFMFLRCKGSDELFYSDYLILMGRGAGKNGLISGITNFLLSDLNGIPNYNVSVIANSEDQAKTSVKEVYDAIERSDVLKKVFKNNIAEISSKTNGSAFAYRTSNGSTKDGLRDGMVIFDEIH